MHSLLPLHIRMDGLGPFSTSILFQDQAEQAPYPALPTPSQSAQEEIFDDFQIAQSGKGGKRDDGAIWLNGLGNPKAGGFLLLVLARRYIV